MVDQLRQYHQKYLVLVAGQNLVVDPAQAADLGQDPVANLVLEAAMSLAPALVAVQDLEVDRVPVVDREAMQPGALTVSSKL